MEWLETTARTVEEAKEALLDRLGVDEQDTEFEVLEEPRPGLFGRTKGQARVRARVRPKTPPARDDRRRRPKKQSDGRGTGSKDSGSKDSASKDSASKDGGPKDGAKEPAPKASATQDGGAAKGGAKGAARAAEDSAATAPTGGGRGERGDRPEGPRLDSDVAAREAREFLVELIDRFGLTAEVAVDIDDEGDLEARVEGEGLGRLIGPRGGVIAAVEELTRTRLQHVASGGSTPRFKLDVGGYRASRRTNLEVLVDDVIARVRETGTPHVLDVVLAGERKLVHDRVAETAPDVATHSEGEDPVRRVVLSPA